MGRLFCVGLVLLFLSGPRLDARADICLPPALSSVPTAVHLVVAPNPYRVDQAGGTLRLRVYAITSGFSLDRVRIYNLGGALVFDGLGPELGFDTTFPLPAGSVTTADAWWDLNRSSGAGVPSGAYWIQYTGRIYDGAETSTVTATCQFMVVR